MTVRNRPPPGRRTPEEDAARGRCRALVRRLGSKIFKVERHHVAVSGCATWPDGLVTAFHGWADLHERLEFCAENPEYVTDGIYIYDADASFEEGPAREARRLAMETEKC